MRILIHEGWYENITLGVVWLDGYEIIRDNSHIMSVDGELLYSFCTGINQPKSVKLSGAESEVGDSGIALARRGIS